MKNIKKLVVVGGFAGLNVSKPFQKTIVFKSPVDKNYYHAFPRLYQVASELSIFNISYPFRSMFKERSFPFSYG